MRLGCTCPSVLPSSRGAGDLHLPFWLSSFFNYPPLFKKLTAVPGSMRLAIGAQLPGKTRRKSLISWAIGLFSLYLF